MGEAAYEKLLNRILAIPLSPPVNPGIVLDEIGTEKVDFKQPILIGTETNKAVIIMRIMGYAAFHLKRISAVLTDEQIRFIYDVDPKIPIEDEIRKECPHTVLSVALKTLRNATNENKTPLQFRTSVSVSAINMARAYDIWIGETETRIIRVVIGSVFRSFEQSHIAELRLAGIRIVGRGFTSANLIVLLISGLQGNEALQIATRLFQAYERELFSLANVLQWWREDANNFIYGFYLGIPEHLGARQYEHLAAIAYRALNLSTLNNYAGNLRNVRFSDEMLNMIEQLKQALVLTPVPTYTEGWQQLIVKTCLAVNETMLNTFKTEGPTQSSGGPPPGPPGPPPGPSGSGRPKTPPPGPSGVSRPKPPPAGHSDQKRPRTPPPGPSGLQPLPGLAPYSSPRYEEIRAAVREKVQSVFSPGGSPLVSPRISPRASLRLSSTSSRGRGRAQRPSLKSMIEGVDMIGREETAMASIFGDLEDGVDPTQEEEPEGEAAEVDQ